MIFSEKKNSGFIALFTVILASFVLILIAVNLSQYAFANRLNVFLNENKNVSLFLAKSCLAEGRTKIIINKNYAGDESFAVGANSCYVFPVVTSGNIKTIVARGIVSESYTFLKLNIDTSSLSFEPVLYQELANYP